MLATLLRRFEPFASLEWATLCSVARHARVLRCAGQRTLAPSGRTHHGRCYLVKGVVRRRLKDGRHEEIAHDAAAARHALLIAGDGAAVETLGAVTLLWIDVDPVAFMLGADVGTYSVERFDPGDRHWMHRFLGPGIVEWLEPNALQAVFRAFTPTVVEPGATIVREGECAERFYVVANGAAEVRRGGRRIAVLVAGDSFGADALVSGAPRNATVAMIDRGRVMSLAATLFERLLAERLVRWIDGRALGCHAIDLTQRERDPDALRVLVGELDLGASYVFDGADTGDRALAAFLAAQRGVRAFARRNSAG
jgi:Cyclic nucleotide-binding domain